MASRATTATLVRRKRNSREGSQSEAGSKLGKDVLSSLSLAPGQATTQLHVTCPALSWVFTFVGSGEGSSLHPRVT